MAIAPLDPEILATFPYVYGNRRSSEHHRGEGVKNGGGDTDPAVIMSYYDQLPQELKRAINECSMPIRTDLVYTWYVDQYPITEIVEYIKFVGKRTWYNNHTIYLERGFDYLSKHGIEK